MADTTWAVHLLGLPPALLALVAILMASFSVITYANHDEVTFQALFEFGCGVALLTITAYLFTYVTKGIQVRMLSDQSNMRSFLGSNHGFS